MSRDKSVNNFKLALIVSLSILFGCEQAKYDPDADAQQMFAQALQEAKAEQQYLMVVFGADWCPDCRKLYENLHSPQTRDYMREHMSVLTVDVGDKDKNLDLAQRLGVSIENGIPVAVFFDDEGKMIGATNEGQLEPSRYLTSAQILRFVRLVVEEQRVTAPTPNKPQGA